MATKEFLTEDGVRALSEAIKTFVEDYVNSKLASNPVLSVNGETPDSSGDVTISKADIGLENVANVGTTNTVSANSTLNVTSGGVYAAIQDAIISELNRAR